MFGDVLISYEDEKLEILKFKFAKIEFTKHERWFDIKISGRNREKIKLESFIKILYILGFGDRINDLFLFYRKWINYGLALYGDDYRIIYSEEEVKCRFLSTSNWRDIYTVDIDVNEEIKFITPTIDLTETGFQFINFTDMQINRKFPRVPIEEIGGIEYLKKKLYGDFLNFNDEFDPNSYFGLEKWKRDESSFLNLTGNLNPKYIDNLKIEHFYRNTAFGIEFTDGLSSATTLGITLEEYTQKLRKISVDGLTACSSITPGLLWLPPDSERILITRINEEIN